MIICFENNNQHFNSQDIFLKIDDSKIDELKQSVYYIHHMYYGLTKKEYIDIDWLNICLMSFYGYHSVEIEDCERELKNMNFSEKIEILKIEDILKSKQYSLKEIHKTHNKLYLTKFLKKI